MPRKNRQTLKESFKKGKKPSEQDFENLIDSSLNILDDGFSNSPETGMGLAPLLEKGTIMSVFAESSDQKPQWELAINTSNRNLEIRRFQDEVSTPFLILKPDGSLEFGYKNKKSVFNGTIEMRAREGSLYKGEVPADGSWNDITDKLEGCQALEVVALSGKKGTGKHAILVATATSCFGKNTRVSKTRSFYGSFGNKICIRWKKERGENSSRLQLKTRFKYGEDIQIQYHITSLWNH